MSQDFNSLSLEFVESLYAEYAKDAQSVSAEWREFFDALPEDSDFLTLPALQPSFGSRSIFNPAGGNGRGAAPFTVDVANLQDRLDQLVRAYRVRGHLIADLDPLDRPRPEQEELDPAFYGFTEADLDRRFSARTVSGPDRATLAEILRRLRNTYCRSIGIQFMHIDDLQLKTWLQERMESCENRLDMSVDQQVRVLTRLTDAVIFEEFIQRKYVGAKSFSLEGAETLIPLLDLTIEKAVTEGIQEIVFGMAHRGRLNVLYYILSKRAREIFREFEDKYAEDYRGSGDVKYHLGYSADRITSSGHKIHLTLCFNPSHLEFVNPVVMGRVRAKQDRDADRDRHKHLGVVIHGDAAFAGEGIVQETLNMSQLEGYRTGGTLHIIVNNQLGFTTSPEEGRSTTYATDVARMLQSPIFHVNGEDPEAAAQVINLAMDFRQRYQRDVVIDMYCYRRRGHNETDEPAFTQPEYVSAIRNRKSVRDSYLDRLLELGGITQKQADEIAERRRALLERELSVARSDESVGRPPALHGVWKGYRGGPERRVKDVETGVPKKRLSELINAMTRLPPDFRPHSKISRLLESRRRMARGEEPMDWSTAEALAFASLATEGYRVRITGQDTARGTFTQRHAVLHDTRTGALYTPMQNLAPDQAPVDIYNSPLSEAGVLGYEYGYSHDYPHGLVCWEAQFGDFVNAAQVVIDQFISSAEDKWERLSGVVLLLPHGFEGMGPEHSSARLERFLVLASEDNIQVAHPSTPAQYFHLLRRQVIRPWRKPLVVLTPKSLLRHSRCVSPLDDLAEGRFRRILPDDESLGEREISRVLLCSGKIYYELVEEREKTGRTDVAILRMEQFYPFKRKRLGDLLAPYPAGTPVFWIQEDPRNMGAWPYLRFKFGARLFRKYPFRAISRPQSASPATGSASSHALEQEEIIDRAFNEEKGSRKRTQRTE